MHQMESGFADLRGFINAFAVQELTMPAAPTTIIRTDQDWRVHVEWNTIGPAAASLAGEFRVAVYLESLGLGPDLKLPNVPGPNEVTVPLSAGAFTPLPLPDAGRRDYSLDIDIPAGQVPTDTDRSRAYKLIVAVTYREVTGDPGPLAGFREGPVLQFYQA